MKWHGPQENTKRTVNKIGADWSKGIMVVTGIGSNPWPLEPVNPTLDSITLNNMLLRPEEQLFIDVRGIRKHAPGQVPRPVFDGSQRQSTTDEAFVARVQALPMRIIFEEKSDPMESVDVLAHSEINRVIAYIRMGMHGRDAACKEQTQAKPAQ